MLSVVVVLSGLDGIFTLRALHQNARNSQTSKFVKRGFKITYFQSVFTVHFLTFLFQDELLHKNTFDPLAQHRDWCPWISVGKENVDPGTVPTSSEDAASHQQGWKVALDLLVPMKNSNSAVSSPAQASQISELGQRCIVI